MAQIYLCFLWHMHQPFYKNLLSGEYSLPWTRMHALKDYYGMVKILEEFPGIHQTFNLVPSLIAQLDEYARGEARDPFLEVAAAPAEQLSGMQRQFILQYFFQANRERLIYRYPRYRSLYERWAESGHDAATAARYFSTPDYRDLQVLSQLSWFDEEFLERDPEVAALVDRVRDYTLADQQLMTRKQREIIGAVLPAYQHAAARGQIEISTTPFYHPILPLLCDSDIAGQAHPGIRLPKRFRHPEDAREQLRLARDFMTSRFGCQPVGLWPSEGSVSDEALALAAESGFAWAASDQGILEKTAAGANLYQPFRWECGGRSLWLLFRDHFLSDLIGFVFSRLNAQDAAADLVRRLGAIAEPFLTAGRDVLIPVILDGENAWEYYDRSGRPFLRALYSRIQADPRFRAVTISEALAQLPAQRLGGIAPGSWINGNFDIWIGAEEDNRAWNLLSAARDFYDRATASASCPPEARDLAWRELLIAEGSDWCWWYGPEHETENRQEFDLLFRNHLSNVYRALGGGSPEELARPIFQERFQALVMPPAGQVRPVIDGEVTSYFEWIGAGLYRAERRAGAMHGKRFLVKELHYGSDGSSFFLRVDFLPDERQRLAEVEARLTLEAVSRARISIQLGKKGLNGCEVVCEGDTRALEIRFGSILEARVPLEVVGLPSPARLRFQLSFWHDGLPVDALPLDGWLELDTRQPEEWTA